MKCPRCQQENPAGQRFCGDCGTPLQLPGATAHLATSYGDVQQFLTEARARERAIGEILRVIGSSPTDGQPVFDAIVRSASQFCDGADCIAVRFDGELMHLMARHNPKPGTLEAVAALFPRRPSRDGTATDRAILDGHVVHVPDILEDPTYDQRRARAAQLRSLLSVPLMRAGNVIGTISVSRAVPGLFSDRQIALLKTFADQAVIAIENVRLFNETKEALEQQTATSDILRVISSSPTDAQPVFDAIVASSVRLCAAKFGAVFRFDGDTLTFVAHHNLDPAALRAYQSIWPRRAEPNQLTGTAILERRVLHVHDVPSEPRYTVAASWRDVIPIRTCVVVPILHGDEPIGVIALYRDEVAPFSERQIDLVKTFADQAVIAIENVRLFNELQEKNRALTRAHAQVTEALDHQTATAEILRVISNSPTDVQPTFEAIAASAAKLCEAGDSAVFRFEAGLIHLMAHYDPTGARGEVIRQMFPMPPGRGSVTARAILTRAIVHIPDIAEDPEYEQSAVVKAGFRSVLSVPILRDEQPIGALTVSRHGVTPFSDAHLALLQTFADQAVIAIENVRLFTELQTSNRDLTKALDTQTATSDILRVISRSQMDVQPVFETIVASAVRLLGAYSGSLSLTAGDQIELAAMTSTDPAGDAAARASFPYPLQSETPQARAIHDRAPFISADVHTDPRVPELVRASARARGFRSGVVVPLLRTREAIGTITVTRREPGRFSDDEVALLQTFADQAVIAIENVRLFKELESKNRDLTETLEQQTATGEILSVIASSPTDIQPVFAAVAASAARLCDAFDATIFQIDGERLRVAVHNGPIASHPVGEGPSLVRQTPSGRAVLDRRTIHVEDAQAEIDEYPEGSEHARRLGFRTVLAVPLIREGVAIGVITLRRTEARLFTERQVALLQTFANQAVIAIENVRLFNELQEKNRALTQAHTQVSEALQQQTATAEILRVISGAHTDTQPVFDAIVQSAARLCNAGHATVLRTDGTTLYLLANYGSSPELLAKARALFPRPLDTTTTAGTAILTRSVVQVPDSEDPSASEFVRQGGRLLGYRSSLAVPMLRGLEAIGAIRVTRRERSRFSDADVELLRTFADQAVIAIENVRLFTELQARTADLTRSVEQLTALGEVGRAVSSTLDLETVLSTIVARAVQLSGLDGGVVFEYDEGAEEFVQRAMTETGQALTEARRATRIRKGEGVLGRTAMTLEPVQVADIAMPGAYEGRLRDVLIDSGIRAILAVPMVREGHLIGCLGVTRNQPGEFSAEIIDLLRTFATQSALAIQNARLFREIEQKSRELEAASRHKSEFLANMSHELRTPLNAVIGFSEVLSERMFGELNEKQEEYLKDIHASGQHLLSLINDILDLSKIEAGKMELELSDFDLPMTIDNALMLVRERAARRGIDLHTSVDERLGQIQGDERKIRQVLLNLLSNATKFTPEGGRIEVRAKPVDAAIEVSVTDTGVGIGPEDQEAVFEEFRQVGTADKKVEGTGLGLALSRKFIELHGGKIWVKSQVGEGSTFTFTVPVRR